MMAAMTEAAPLQAEAAYRALCTHDARFDGRLFVGVTSTGIYCRPVCRVRVPQQRNCRFFASAALAEAQGFRPCLRCRPELAPGWSLMDSSRSLAQQAAQWLQQAVREGQDLPLPALAARLGVTDRHLRRIFAQVHGVSPVAWLTTQRLLLAKQLLTDTALPVTQVALASGFGSLRRFNDAFAQHYRMSPQALRRQRGPGAPAIDATPLLRLAYRPPLDQAGLLRFFAQRALPGVELVDGHGLRRTLALQHRGQWLTGWVAVQFLPGRSEVGVALSPSLMPALGAVLARVRHLLDLDAEPALVDPVLATLGPAPVPGLRLPGTACGFELAVRVVLGQQVTVAAARTLTHRLVQRFGAPVATPWPGLDRLFPCAAALAQASPAQIGELGIVRQRVGALQALAQAVHEGRLQLQPEAPLHATLDTLKALPGIGDWSAQLIAMRALAWPDAWPATDIGLLNALGTRDVAQAQARAETWRPWRSYAVIRWWQTLETA
jgi:AraC family transcriptional regulator of adaptative response / DNA-3-methyladenine glycosylase II